MNLRERMILKRDYKANRVLTAEELIGKQVYAYGDSIDLVLDVTKDSFWY